MGLERKLLREVGKTFCNFWLLNFGVCLCIEKKLADRKLGVSKFGELSIYVGIKGGVLSNIHEVLTIIPFDWSEAQCFTSERDVVSQHASGKYVPNDSRGPVPRVNPGT